MPKQVKIHKVDEIRDSLSKAKGVFMTDFNGLSVEEITQLRREFHKANVNYLVVKNTLARISAKDVGMDQILPFLTGPTGLAIALDDPTAPIRIISDFAKGKDKLSVKAAVIDGQLLSAAEAEAIKDLPPREILLAQVVSGIAAPLSGLVGGLKAMLNQLVYTINAIKEKKA